MIKSTILLSIMPILFNTVLIMSMDPKNIAPKTQRLSLEERLNRIDLQGEIFEIVVDAPCPQRAPTAVRKNRITLQKRMLKSLSQGSRSSSPKR